MFNIVKAPKILLPKNCNLAKYAVIACDQFTQDREYWTTLENYISGSPSTINLTLPEIYLKDDTENRISKINAKMEEYLTSGVFDDEFEGFILVDRKTPYNERRLGLVLSIDLEEYSFEKGSHTRIRATEGTIVERLPPRIKIRENALMEFPHIMLLIDDKEKSVIEPIFEKRTNYEKAYDFDLNMNGGHITGYKIKATKEIVNNLYNLISNDNLIKKYGVAEEFLFAVGDGNHSLATAKCCWENLKKTLSKDKLKDNPARYALCEVVNLYDEGLKFEPIHRYIYEIDAAKFVSGLKTASLVNNLKNVNEKFAKILLNDKIILIDIDKDLAVAIKLLDLYISEFIEKNGGTVDYIHGEESVVKLTKNNKNSVGIILPKLEKESLFKSVIDSGSLPRKTFSMGEGIEKRYYIEGKKIK